MGCGNRCVGSGVWGWGEGEGEGETGGARGLELPLPTPSRVRNRSSVRIPIRKNVTKPYELFLNEIEFESKLFILEKKLEEKLDG